jgi:hypothetical protein
MNDNNTSIELAGASAPALPDELAAEFSDFSDEQKAILAESVQLGVAAMGATVAWIRSMRKMRGSLLSNCQGHTGWERVCGRVYRIGVNEANAMLRGLDGWEARFFGESGRDPVPPSISGDLSPSFFSRLGKVKEDLRPAVLDAIASGEISISSKAVQRKASDLKKQSHRVGLKPVAKPLPKPPASMAQLPKMTASTPTGFGVHKEISRSKYGDLPERDQEFNFLVGKAAANSKFNDELVALLTKASKGSVGKIVRIKALAAALHREFKGVGDRYQRSWDKDSKYPTYMTLWQHIWLEDNEFHLHDELDAVRQDISEANRYFSIAVMRLFNDDLEITP